MDIRKKSLVKQQIRWKSLHSINIAIILSFIFFFSIGIGQSYTIFDPPLSFTTPLVLPLMILLMCFFMLHTMLNKKKRLTQRLMPLTCLSITFFVTINSHFQASAFLNSSLYFCLLLPVFYSYLFAYSTLYLMINNIALILSYVFISIIGDFNILTFLFNSTFLMTLCYISIFTQLRNSKVSDTVSETKFEKKNILSQKNGQYLNRIIHDIRQPLSSLSLYSHLLEDKLHNTPHSKLAQNIKKSSEELERWIASLLDLARLDGNAITATKTEFTLASVLIPVIKKYQYQASQIGLKLNSRLPDLVVKSDNRLLPEIIEVLLNNAIVHGNQTTGSVILLTARRSQGKILLQVWNQGKKIAPSILDILFDEIAQADNALHNRSKGIGLGLSIAQRKANLCQTTIEVKNNHHGSRFTIALEPAQYSPQQLDLNKLSNNPEHYRILLIDDDQSILCALSMLLENWGYLVDCANTAESGLHKYNTAQYNLVISDYRLPDQKTGLDVIKAIKAKGDIPAILLTGEADPRKLKEVQGTDKAINYKVLNKPVKPASLRFLLKELLK